MKTSWIFWEYIDLLLTDLYFSLKICNFSEQILNVLDTSYFFIEKSWMFLKKNIALFRNLDLFLTNIDLLLRNLKFYWKILNFIKKYWNGLNIFIYSWKYLITIESIVLLLKNIEVSFPAPGCGIAIGSWMRTYRDLLGVRSLWKVLPRWSNHHNLVCHRMAFYWIILNEYRKLLRILEIIKIICFSMYI